jgi:hypothetical protein
VRRRPLTVTARSTAASGPWCAPPGLPAAPANTSGAAFFKADLGNSDPSAAAIDALFTNAGKALAFDQSDLDLKGLGLILADLVALQAGPGGVLTGPIP